MNKGFKSIFKIHILARKCTDQHNPFKMSNDFLQTVTKMQIKGLEKTTKTKSNLERGKTSWGKHTYWSQINYKIVALKIQTQKKPNIFVIFFNM